MFKTVLLLLLSAAAVLAAFHDVDVGMGGLKFTPQSLTAAAGDKVRFHFYPGDHGVASSAYNKPCAPNKNYFWSGYISPASGVAKKMFTVTINNTNPIWVYCPNSNFHCQSGMAMVINQGTGAQTLGKYKTIAKTTRSKTPPKVQGGTIGPNRGGK